jgi:beta-phosphoglucomutase
MSRTEGRSKKRPFLLKCSGLIERLKMKMIIFDMDGVLTDSEPLICEAATRMFLEIGHTVQAEDFQPFIGTGENRYIGGVAEKYGIVLDIAAAKQRTYRIYLDLVPKRLKAFPGAVELVRACRAAGLRITVASSTDRVKIDANLRQIGLSPEQWDSIVAAEDVTLRKPHPDIFLAAAAKMGIPPAECSVIEDSPNGIQAAKAAGMTCFAVAQTFQADFLHDADRVFSSIAEITPFGQNNHPPTFNLIYPGKWNLRR